jgi:hypothetical protein
MFPIELWNMTDRLEQNLSRTNNSVESWHAIWNADSNVSPLLSKFVHQMEREERHWERKVEQFEAAPADGIRGRGTMRKNKYVARDANLLGIFNQFAEKEPYEYLMMISRYLKNFDNIANIV